MATQPVWQASEPIQVNVDFDVPAYGAKDAAKALRAVSVAEHAASSRKKQQATAYASQLLSGGHGLAKRERMLDGAALARELSALLGEVPVPPAGAPKSEPAIDTSKEAASRELLLASQKAFNAASSSGWDLHICCDHALVLVQLMDCSLL